jgi:hypothetical protein
MPNNEQILTLVNLAMRICTKNRSGKVPPGHQTLCFQFSPDQTHIKKSPKWPLALTLLNIEVLTSSRFIAWGVPHQAQTSSSDVEPAEDLCSKQDHNWWNHPSSHSVEAHGHRQQLAQCDQQEWHRWFEPQCLCWSGQINVKEQMHILFRFQHTQLVKQNWQKPIRIQKLETGSHAGALHITFSCHLNQLLMKRLQRKLDSSADTVSLSQIQRVPLRSQGIESLTYSNNHTQVITQNMKKWNVKERNTYGYYEATQDSQANLNKDLTTEDTNQTT